MGAAALRGGGRDGDGELDVSGGDRDSVFSCESGNEGGAADEYLLGFADQPVGAVVRGAPGMECREGDHDFLVPGGGGMSAGDDRQPGLFRGRRHSCLCGGGECGPVVCLHLRCELCAGGAGEAVCSELFPADSQQHHFRLRGGHAAGQVSGLVSGDPGLLRGLFYFLGLLREKNAGGEIGTFPQPQSAHRPAPREGGSGVPVDAGELDAAGHGQSSDVPAAHRTPGLAPIRPGPKCARCGALHGRHPERGAARVQSRLGAVV